MDVGKSRRTEERDVYTIIARRTFDNRDDRDIPSGVSTVKAQRVNVK